MDFYHLVIITVNIFMNKILGFIQGGAKVGLPLLIWKITQLINSNTKINTVFHILTTVNLLLPNPVFCRSHFTYTFFLSVSIYIFFILNEW